jgi:hypothetical protein
MQHHRAPPQAALEPAIDNLETAVAYATDDRDLGELRLGGRYVGIGHALDGRGRAARISGAA